MEIIQVCRQLGEDNALYIIIQYDGKSLEKWGNSLTKNENLWVTSHLTESLFPKKTNGAPNHLRGTGASKPDPMIHGGKRLAQKTTTAGSSGSSSKTSLVSFPKQSHVPSQ